MNVFLLVTSLKEKPHALRMNRFPFQELKETWVIWDPRAILASLAPLARKVSKVMPLFSANSSKGAHGEHILNILCHDNVGFSFF